ncbi:MAG: 50S ribosomal protein L19 [bacterium]|uniref:Large ribosomal subunit protein bL19 n=2 Tax=Bacteria candidate phyla TaxID=1783234 RepID=A0A101I294_UNCT6|nr:MAG: ribosomal protein L19 [candidate division TA06 bacterium 32_111]KUK87696.1 MAG: ribosomal protein L19 [candidate division TA06 bacterium 34_109]MDI6699829.1 50S ribosomal protein L19 [bacterium]HAF07534.1 50S ribosomal protein L19 [candidate division WOR-3 bacterium]HCP17603.1 50S ribosomal protein L19 [candidate division WOR-3 bacterium]
MAKLNIDRIKKDFEKSFDKSEKYDFNIGDTVDVSVKIEESGKTRTQKFRGIVIARRGTSVGQTVTVRKISQGIGVERIFPINSPNVSDIKVVKKSKVRRAKLNYMRGRTGKAATKVE